MKMLRMAVLLMLAIAFAALTGCSSTVEDDNNALTPTTAATVPAYTMPAATTPAATAPAATVPGTQDGDTGANGLLTTEAPTAQATLPPA